jgi:hypothetical protein
MRCAWFLPLCLVGCSSSSDASIVSPTLSLLAGQETDTWTGSVAATQVNVETVELLSGLRSTITTVPAPATQVTLPVGLDPTAPSRIEATGLDATGAKVVWGATVPYTGGDLAAYGAAAFVARSGGWSRAPEGLAQPHMHSVIVQALAKYVIALGGDAVGSANLTMPDTYDVSLWQTFSGVPQLPSTPKSLVVGYAVDPDGIDTDVELLMIDDTSASWFNVTLGITDVAITAPTGLTFAEIAGGQAIALPDNTVYVVGATRQDGAPTDKVLRISASGTFQTLVLGTPRVGAAAAVVGNALVVAGGSATGAGAEVLNAGETAFVPLAFPADPTAGAGLAAFDMTKGILVGGKDPSTGMAATIRTLDTSCTASCTLADSATLPVALSRTQVFALAPTQWLALGESDDGENHAYSIGTSGSQLSVVEKVFREPRKGATPVLLPNSQVGVLGGERVDTGAPTMTVEAYFP